MNIGVNGVMGYEGKEPIGTLVTTEGRGGLPMREHDELRERADQMAEDTALVVVGWVGACAGIVLAVILGAYLWASGG